MEKFKQKGWWKMKRLYSRKRSAAIIGLSCAVIAITAVAEAFYNDNVEEYILTSGNKQLHFVAQPQLGYVLKRRDEIGSMDTLNRFLKNAGDVKIIPIRRLGRRGISIVYNEQPAHKNEKIITSLTALGQIKYASPLFSFNGEKIAIIPEVVIRVKPGTEIEQVQVLCETAGCAIIKRMEFTEQEYLLEVLAADADGVFAAVDRLNRAEAVDWAFPNMVFWPRHGDQPPSPGGSLSESLSAQATGETGATFGVTADDTYFPNQWHLENAGQSGGTASADVRAPEAWGITTGDPNISVAIIDHGIDLSHPDLVDNLVAGYDFWDDDDAPEPGPDSLYLADPHGTACAGLVAARGNNSLGVAGVTWACKIIPVRVDIGGEMPTNEADIATALRWAAANGADVLSNSWGFYGPLPLIHAAIIDITKTGGIGRDGKGCTVFFCAGNNTSFIWWPAVYSEVIAVGATNHRDIRASFSNVGPELDVTAPGDDVWTTDISGPNGYTFFGLYDLQDYYPTFSGTSAATPIAAGVAALILSVEPGLTNEEVRHFVECSVLDLGETGWDERYGWGRVDARAALDMVLAKRADLNNDWKVGLEDLLILIEFWRTTEPSADIAPAAKRDGIVDEQDLELLIRYWKTEIPEMDVRAQ